MCLNILCLQFLCLHQLLVHLLNKWGTDPNTNFCPRRTIADNLNFWIYFRDIYFSKVISLYSILNYFFFSRGILWKLFVTHPNFNFDLNVAPCTEWLLPIIVIRKCSKVDSWEDFRKFKETPKFTSCDLTLLKKTFLCKNKFYRKN